MISQNCADFCQIAFKCSTEICQGKNERAKARPMTNHSTTICILIKAKII